MQFSVASRLLNAPLRLSRLSLGLHNVELVKWVAVLAMLADHFNRHVLTHKVASLYFVGRIAFPLFAIALGVSLCGRDQSSMSRAVKRTLMWAAITQPLTWLVRDPAPLNILFVLAAGVLIVSQVERRTWWSLASVGLALTLSPFAEYSVSGVAMACAGVYFGRHRSLLSALALVASIAFLEVENRNHFALLALPVLYVLTKLDLAVPRIKNSMQLVYAGHFPLMWLVRLFA